ncbi:Gfo/Idh/MocA family oxidoreductase [Angustibacter peucedani]
MRVGLVGTGRIGAEHARVVAEHPLVDEVVLADVDPQRAAAVAAGLGAGVAGSVDALLAQVDAVVITAATTAHPELIVAAARAGLPAFCEKPVAPDLAGSVLVLEEVERTGAVVQIGFQRRFDRGYTRARESLHDGQIGELRRAHVITGDPAPPPAEYVPTSGGLWRDCHVHDVDALRFVTGREVVEVYSVGANRGADYFGASGDVDESVAVMTMDDGTLVTVQGSRYNGAGYDVRMELAGTTGTLVVGLDDAAALRSAEDGVDFPAGPSWPGFWPRFLPAYRAEIEAFVELAAGRRDNPCSVAEALEAFYVAEAATRSRTERRAVRVEEVRPR